MRWRFRPGEEFERHAKVWDALIAASTDLPFLRSEFVLPALAEFGGHKQLVAVLDDGGEPAALALVHQRKPGVWETFQPAQLPLGALVLRPDIDFETLLSGLIEALPGFALSIAVSQQDPLAQPRPAESGRLATMDYISTARVVISCPFDDYWLQRGKNLRTNTKKQRTRLAADGVDVRLDVLTDPADVQSAIAEYSRLESTGWKGGEGTAVRHDNAQGRFYARAFEALCRAGIGRIYRYAFGDRVVAMDLCIDGSRALVVLKTAFDETYKTFSPASLMRQDYFRLAFDDARWQTIEFYGRVMEWHLRWTDDVRTLYHVNYYRWPWLRRAHASLRARRA